MNIACALRNMFLIGLSVCIFSLMSGCTGKEPEPGYSHELTREEMIRVNQFLAGKDMELINAYISRRNWDIEFTGTGLGFQIYQAGEGQRVERGHQITINYTSSLLDGRVCYSSDGNGPKSFRVGQGGVESGLEEGVLMLRVGDKARFILPPFLAHGLIGDQNRIPPRAVLIYEVEVLEVIPR
ncbi:MAG: peptidylprolyl isomerase [Marinilabiliales bacterium]|nr:MAG: peptidylprolyl isomerase [Marinilabiliales bacterium]